MEDLIKNASSVKIAQRSDKVYKDECVYSFDTPESETGLYVSLTSFLGLGQDHVENYYKMTNNAVFLHIKRDKKEILPKQAVDGPAKKITRLAIGTPDGFNPDQPKYSFEEHYALSVLPTFASVPYPNDELPSQIRESVESVLAAESATKVAEMEGLAGTWDGEAKIITKHAANLLQLDNGRKIPPSGWKCDKCDLTQNLWLNLTDGTILCGRKFYDGTGGNDHAVEHYRATGHPLAVKLGTITKDGKGDVFSYDEDDMVEDPNLIEHLAHWGINIAQMEKTDKSMVELELYLNQKFGEWVALQEAASKLTPIYGSGYTGLTNLGNSCYLNSVMQMIFVIPDFIRKYVTAALEIFHAHTRDPANDFNVQMAKLGVGLLSGRYSKRPTDETEDEGRQGIPPRMFKVLIGRDNATFASNRQQDASEFLLHLINIIERHNVNRENPAECFKFKVEERYECGGSKKVKYSYRPEYLLPLPIPLDAATNKDEVAAYEAEKKEAESKGQRMENDVPVVRPQIELVSCLESFARSETVEQFYSTALNEKTIASKITRLATFPDYLLIHLKKFTMREDWTCVKLDVAVKMPDILDLNWLKGRGLQPDEELLPESQPPPPVYNEEILDQLTKMGFPPEACKRALYLTGNRSLSDALNWTLEHVCDSDFANPFVPPGIDSSKQMDGKSEFAPNPEHLEYLLTLGFVESHARKALEATDNEVERAVDWIFSHPDEVSVSSAMEEDSNAPAGPVTPGGPSIEFRDGNGHYKLVGFISHMGTSTMVGHYVCHLLRDDRWVIYNDEKVSLSENPPKDLGYIYIYKRL